jgi:hypothetical protein
LLVFLYAEREKFEDFGEVVILWREVISFLLLYPSPRGEGPDNYRER